jgi:8-oxo-dGTP pyrophosphatase MutT (NUDIX family)
MNCPDLSTIKQVTRNHIAKPVGQWRYYSVLLPLVEKADGIYVLYELRSPDLSVQPNEISFPGGGIHDGESPEDSARRETVEELGIPQDAVEIVSGLDYLVNYNNSVIYCFLGALDASALMHATINQAEVTEYFLVPLTWLIESSPEIYISSIEPVPAPDFPLKKLAPHGGYNWRKGTSAVPLYTWFDSDTGTERLIWGMTARLTMAFVELLKTF